MKRGSRWEADVAELQRRLIAKADMIALAIEGGEPIGPLREEFDGLMVDYNALHGAGGVPVAEVRRRLLVR